MEPACAAALSGARRASRRPTTKSTHLVNSPTRNQHNARPLLFCPLKGRVTRRARAREGCLWPPSRALRMLSATTRSESGGPPVIPTQAELIHETEELIRRQRQRGAAYRAREGPGASAARASRAPRRRPRAAARAALRERVLERIVLLAGAGCGAGARRRALPGGANAGPARALTTPRAAPTAAARSSPVRPPARRPPDAGA